MMSLTFILFPILLGSVVAYFLFKSTTKGRVNRKIVSIQLRKKTHFQLLAIFTMLLILLTIVAELTVPNKPMTTLPPKANAHFEENMWNLENQIFNREEIDPSFILEKRTHPIGDTLIIQQSEEPYNDPTIYLERRSSEEQTVEEIIYKPAVLVNGYDFSNQVRIETPNWTDDTLSFPTATSTTIFTTFQETNTLGQLTKKTSSQMDSNDAYSTIRPMIVHLIVPRDLEIIADEDYLMFIDEQW